MDPDPHPEIPVDGMHIWGWMSPIELLWLQSAARTMGSIAEIGSLHGRSAFALLSACDGPVYCVDPWNDEGDHCYTSFMGACGHFPNLVPVRAFSPAAADQVPEVDMVFIDGAHDYDQVIADINAWLPKARRLICGHDYQEDGGGFPGVAQAVHEVFGRPVLVGEGTSIWMVEP